MCMTTIAPHISALWVLLSEKLGDNNQSIALAKAIGLPYSIIHLNWKAGDDEEHARGSALLDRSRGAAEHRRELGLHEPWPDAVVFCGRRAERFALWIKRESRNKTKILKIGRAGKRMATYDLLIATPQFPVPPLPNVVELHFPPTLPSAGANGGASHVTALHEFPKPWFTIFLGGEVKQFLLCTDTLRSAAAKIQAAADALGGTIVVSTSRRTPPEMLAAVESGLTRTPYIYRWSAEHTSANPYSTLLAESKAIFVTADSVSMITDACKSKTATYVIELPRRLNLKQIFRRIGFRAATGMAETLQSVGLRAAAEQLSQFQSWMHSRRILRFPKDLSRFYQALYHLGLALPFRDFAPTRTLPTEPDPDILQGVLQMERGVARCRELLSRSRLEESRGPPVILCESSSAPDGRLKAKLALVKSIQRGELLAHEECRRRGEKNYANARPPDE